MCKWAFVFLYLFSSFSHAGDVELYNDTWDNIPRVVIQRGLNGESTAEYVNVARGIVGSARGRLCYKRSTNPSDPNSPLQSGWSCASQTVSGTYKLNLN